MPRFHRVLGLLSLCLLAAFTAACEPAAPASFHGDPDKLLAAASDAASRLAARQPDRLKDEEVLALGYLERARMGLGSPFRLAEYAQHDARLSPALRQTVAYAILWETLRGRTYAVEPAVAALLHAQGDAPADVGQRHLTRIERMVFSASTPNAGERAVRLAYLLAEAEGLAQPAARTVLPGIAALVSDRRRARDDARDLLAAAAEQQADPLAVLALWRRDRRLSVEQPAERQRITDAAETLEALQMVRALRTLAFRPVSEAWAPASATVWRGSRLSPTAAARLRLLAGAHNYPPQAPIAVAVALNRERFVGDPRLTPAQRAARTRFAEEAWNEERLVAAAVLLHNAGAGDGVRLPLIMMQAAVYLRAWNQEDPWMPGDPAPTVKELQTRFGLANLQFDAHVPDAWRPYYRVVVGRGLADAERVFPGVSFRGLTVRVGQVPGEQAALAMHLPRSRTLLLPPATGAGTLAHELAHDLDWQLARHRYSSRGSYATDYAVRGGRADRIAVSMEGLSESFSREPGDTMSTAHRSRPAEVFARGTDWLVSTLLARDGRVSGYVSSFQDDALTGYGTTRGFAVDGGGVVALLALLDEAVPVSAEAREWLLGNFGPERNLSALEMTRAVAAAGRTLPTVQRVGAIREAERQMLAVLGEAVCGGGARDGLQQRLHADRTLVRAAATGAIRGAVADGIRSLAQTWGEFISPATLHAWTMHRLYGAPGPTDTVPSALADTVESWLAGAQNSMVEITASPRTFDLVAPPALCRGNPFAWKPKGHPVRTGWEAAGLPVAGPLLPSATQESLHWATTPATAARELSPWERLF